MKDDDFVNKYNPVTKTYDLVPRPMIVSDDDPIEHETERKQPPISRGRTAGVPKYRKGGQRSIRVLKNLRYDPITALVDQYRSLEKELNLHEGMRSGAIVMLKDNGKTREYDSEAHMKCYELLIKVGSDLTRYGYARLPEGVIDAPNKVPTLIINMPGKDEPFIINQPTTRLPEYEESNDE